ncbi:WYL domain-containing protein [Moritella sp. 24]|uniref:helix-turn-helix transcriptional regulator n=1 Tax=Moritella sp. 24 TaxID=2746230 RepID=UPI001BAD19BC|nr:WYL domain-containing protein [Moritella sp. 24]QUM75084.1 WYL domain-containing protein [Moritella sp. 24]
MKSKNEKLAKRLGTILARLNAGERLYLKNLEAEFNVHERTIWRDFERLSYLPLRCEDGCYFLDMSSVRQQSSNNMNKLIQNIGLESFIPIKLNMNNWQTNNVPTFLFKNVRIEDVSSFTDLFDLLTNAISAQYQISFTYKDKKLAQVEPYRLVNDRGIWYLAAVYQGNLHSFRIAYISQLQLSDDKYKPQAKVQEEIIRQGMQWLAIDKSDVLIQVDADVAPRFFEGKLLPNIQILKEMDDGSLLISSQVTRLYDVMPILKAWMPYVEVLSPISLKQELIRDLYASLERTKMM